MSNHLLQHAIEVLERRASDADKTADGFESIGNTRAGSWWRENAARCRAVAESIRGLPVSEEMAA